MASERILPDDPLAFIVRCVREKRLFWTYHVNMRLKNRSISRLVTAYRPSPAQWGDDFKRRRTP